MNIVIVGCGGIGGWLAQCLVKMLGPEDNLVLVDKDKFEKHNADRQLHCAVGSAKCDALRRVLGRSARCNLYSIVGYLGDVAVTAQLADLGLVDTKTVWFCGADNHRARLSTLKMVDYNKGMAIICANEYTDAEAYVYLPEWEDTKMDPRVFYPEILTDKSDDPLKPPCTGEILESAPQLALANMSAANYGMWLWYFWSNGAQEITDPDAQKTCVHLVASSVGRVRYTTIGDSENGN